MKIKICGITNLPDAITSIEAGADMLGFNFYAPSPRYIDPTDCKKILDELLFRGLHSINIGIFVNHTYHQIIDIADYCQLTYVQLSGDETVQFVEALGDKAIKCIRPGNFQNGMEDVEAYPVRSKPPKFIIDANIKGSFGGTGKLADWEAASSIGRSHEIMLAGGLTPENIGEAIAFVHPWGVDTASGVETSPGTKDARKIFAFIDAVRNIEQTIIK